MHSGGALLKVYPKRPAVRMFLPTADRNFLLLCEAEGICFGFQKLQSHRQRLTGSGWTQLTVCSVAVLNNTGGDLCKVA